MMTNQPILETRCNKVKIRVEGDWGVKDGCQKGLSGEYG